MRNGFVYKVGSYGANVIALEEDWADYNRENLNIKPPHIPMQKLKNGSYLLSEYDQEQYEKERRHFNEVKAQYQVSQAYKYFEWNDYVRYCNNHHMEPQVAPCECIGNQCNLDCREEKCKYDNPQI